MREVLYGIYAIALFVVFADSALAITPLVADPSVAIEADAPTEIREALLQTYFLGTGTFDEYVLNREVWGGSHKVVFRIEESVVSQTTNKVISFYVPCGESDPAAGYGPRPEWRSKEDDLWGAAFKFVPGKRYAVRVSYVGEDPILLLRRLYAADEWPQFRQDVLDAASGTYVWRDPSELKKREWIYAENEAEKVYAQYTNGLVERAVWRTALDKAEALRIEFKKLRGRNLEIE